MNVDDEMECSWLDGRRVRTRLATSRGLHYGDGVFRTILKYNSIIIDIELQLNKLLEDSAALGLSPAMRNLRTQLERAGRGHDHAVLKLLVMRRATGRGYPPRTSDVQILAQRSPLPRFPPSCWEYGIAGFTSDIRMAAQPRLAGIKHLNRLEQVLASRDWPEGAQEAILGDADSHPICGTRSNLFWVHDGCLYTPELSTCGVAGVMRGKVLSTAAIMGIECRIECCSQQELKTADEVFVTNSLIGIWPLHRLDQRVWQAPGPMTRTLMLALAHPRLI